VRQVGQLPRSRIQLMHKAEVRLLTLGFEEESLSILLLYRICRAISVLHKRSEVLIQSMFFLCHDLHSCRDLPKFRRKQLCPYSSVYSEIGEGRFWKILVKLCQNTRH